MFKKLFVLFVVLLMTGCASQESKAPRDLFVIHIHGDWCMTCKTVDPVVHTLEDYYENNENAEFIVFDETDPQTLAKSKKTAEELGLEDIFEYERHTGEVLFVDKNSKKILTAFAGVDARETYIDATEKLIKGEAVKGHPKKPAKYELSKPTAEQAKNAKLFIIDIHHDKCSTCGITAPVFEEAASYYVDNDEICFLTFDLSTPRTIDETRKLADKLGLRGIFDSYKHTGEVLFVNAENQEILKSIVAERDEDTYHEIIDDLTVVEGEELTAQDIN